MKVQRLTLIGSIVSAACLALNVPCQGQVEWLTNGNFEDLSGAFPAGWTIGGGPPGTTSGLAGTSNAAVMYPDLFGGSLTQSNLEAGPQWTFDLYFASAAPPTSDDRSLQFILNSGSGLINMRVNGDGSLQAFGGTWQDVIPASVMFSTDFSGDGDFDDPGDVSNVHRLRLVGDFTSTPSYEVMISAAGSNAFSMTSGVVSVFDGTPIVNSGIASVSLRSQSSMAPYVVDEVSLMAEQAPVLPFSGLNNGDFEDVSGTFPSGWTLTRPAITQHAGLGGSSTGLYLRKQADGGGRVTQTLPTSPGSEWELDLLFATEDPGDNNARGLNLILNNDPNNGNLNLRVNGDGSVQTVTSTPTTTWIDIPNLSSAVQFSVDGNADGDFSDTEDTLNVHRLVLQGNYATASPEYTVFLSAANSTDLTLSGTAANWFTAAPGEGASIGTVIISAQSSGGSYLVDQVVLRSLAASVPGDYNGDGQVNAADYTVWRDTKNSTVDAGTGADGDGSGMVDDDDYDFWAQRFNGGSGAASGQAVNVPEPATLLMLLIAAASLLPKACRRRFR
ncbi:MAG: PEP-CTERM sorting domain-containing protein [Pirellulales bacterium]